MIRVLGLSQVVAHIVLPQPSAWTKEAMRRLLIGCAMLDVPVAFRRDALNEEPDKAQSEHHLQERPRVSQKL